MLDQRITIAIATDGGAKSKKGSIRFVIAKAHDGDRYFQSYGQPGGIEPQSFRSKVCSLLAVVHFLQLLVKYNNFLHNTTKEIRSEFEIYTDSSSMVTKLNCMNEYPLATLKMTLHADWDVLSALHTALKGFPTRPTLHHVRSH